jgi:hypothetical protein
MMKIKYEKEVEDCSECFAYSPQDEFGYSYCNIDGENNICRENCIDSCNYCDKAIMPCKKRPCPIEVK